MVPGRLVLQHLRAWIDYSCKRIRLYFWRIRGGMEVDFVLYGENTLIAIEVKNTKNPRGKDVTGLKNFLKDYQEVPPVLLYRGVKRKKRDGIVWLLVEEF